MDGLLICARTFEDLRHENLQLRFLQDKQRKYRGEERDEEKNNNDWKRTRRVCRYGVWRILSLSLRTNKETMH